MDLTAVTNLLETQRESGLHEGAQVYVSLGGETLLDTALGESRPGQPLRRDDLMLWYSAGKPLTAIAILQLWEQGRLDLDDRIADHVVGWGGGKERATIRHVLTHTGGFPLYGQRALFDEPLPFSDLVALVAEAPAEYEPGTQAGYHLVSGWIALGAVVESASGMPVDQFVREHVLAPVGATTARMGIPLDEQADLGDRVVPVHWKGHQLPMKSGDRMRLVDYRVDEVHNAPALVATTSPGGGMRGPARDLAAVYESLLGFGPPLLESRTVEVLGAVHRYGMRDRTLMGYVPWGLGVQVDFSGGAGRRCFGHGGMASSRGLADPERGLVFVVVTNGLPGFVDAESRLIDLTDAVYSALPPDMQLTRRPVRRIDRDAVLST